MTEDSFIRCITHLLSNGINISSSPTDAICAMNAFTTDKSLFLKQLHTGDSKLFVDCYKERLINKN